MRYTCPGSWTKKSGSLYKKIKNSINRILIHKIFDRPLVGKYLKILEYKAVVMAMNNLSTDGEFRYIIQWFNEWSELQRDDFVPVLLEYLQQGGPNEVYMNGIVNSVSQSSIQDKPMSLFQCRVSIVFVIYIERYMKRDELNGERV